MTTYLPRSEWNARPPASYPGALNPNEVAGVALHWPGMEKPIYAKSSVAAALRGWQDYHIDVRHWADIAYQIAVDQAGRAWTLRGLVTRSAANGDAEVNSTYGAILLIIAPGEEPSIAMQLTTQNVVRDYRKFYPHGTAIVPHSAIRPDPTDCPGDAVRRGITRGYFTPHTTLPPEEDDMDQNTIIGVDTTTDPDSPMTMGKLVARVNRIYDTTLDGDGTASDGTLLRRLCQKLDVETAP